MDQNDQWRQMYKQYLDNLSFSCFEFKCFVSLSIAIKHLENNENHLSMIYWKTTWSIKSQLLPFSLICDFGKQHTCGNVSKISISLRCYRHDGLKSTNHSPLAWRRVGQKVTLVAVIGGFRSDLSITRKTDGNLGNIFAGVLFSKVVYQWKRW